MNGLKVTIGPVKKVKERSYYLLTDEGHEYIYIAQSTQKSDAEMFEFLSEIGKDAGLVEYDDIFISIVNIYNFGIEYLYYGDPVTLNYKEAISHLKFINGAPFGIKEN